MPFNAFSQAHMYEKCLPKRNMAAYQSFRINLSLCSDDVQVYSPARDHTQTLREIVPRIFGVTSHLL